MIRFALIMLSLLLALQNAQAGVRVCEDFFTSPILESNSPRSEAPALTQSIVARRARFNSRDEAELKQIVDSLLHKSGAAARSSRWYSRLFARSQGRSPVDSTRLSVRAELLARLETVRALKSARIENEAAREAIYRLAFESWPETTGPLGRTDLSLFRQLVDEGLQLYFGAPNRSLPSWQVSGARIPKLFPLLEGHAAVPGVAREAFRHWMRLTSDLKPRDEINSKRGFASWREGIHAFTSEPGLTLSQLESRWTSVINNSDLISDQGVFDALQVELESRRAVTPTLQHLTERLRAIGSRTNPLGVRPIAMLSKYRGEEQGIFVENSIVTGRIDMHPVYLRTIEERRRYLVTIDASGRFLDAQGRAIDTEGRKAIYATGLNGEIYLKLDAVPGEFHHSSFLAGEEVLAAGEMVLRDGYPTLLDNNSGHYHPDAAHLEAFARYLRSIGVPLPDGTVHYF